LYKKFPHTATTFVSQKKKICSEKKVVKINFVLAFFEIRIQPKLVHKKPNPTQLGSPRLGPKMNQR